MSLLDKFIHFYYEQIFSHSKKSSILNDKIKKYFIIDYANIIHILYEKYKDVRIVAEKINRFLRKYSTNMIFIVSKPVTIGDIIIDIDIIDPIPNVYLFNIEYKLQISSNIDDILTHFLCVVIFVGLLRLNINPKNKIVLITNDKQNFCKNLFELTEDEKKTKINLLKDVTIDEIVMGKKRKIKEIKNFLNEYMTIEKKTKTLKCTIGEILKVVQKNHLSDFSYDTLNSLQKQITNKCMRHSRSRGKLKKYFYLYAYIKYIQSYLNNDFYGSMSKEKIILLFR